MLHQISSGSKWCYRLSYWTWMPTSACSPYCILFIDTCTILYAATLVYRCIYSVPSESTECSKHRTLGEREGEKGHSNANLPVLRLPNCPNCSASGQDGTAWQFYEVGHCMNRVGYAQNRVIRSPLEANGFRSSQPFPGVILYIQFRMHLSALGVISQVIQLSNWLTTCLINELAGGNAIQPLE